MPISTTARITNLTPYDAVFLSSTGHSAVFRSKGIAHCRTELIDSPIAKIIADATGGTLVKLDACTSFFCTEPDGSIICERLPATNPGHFLLVTEEIARRANQHKIYRGIIFPKEYKIVERKTSHTEGKLMVIRQIGTFWSHQHK